MRRIARDGDRERCPGHPGVAERSPRNGRIVERDALAAELTSSTVVLLNHSHERHPAGSAEYVSPARFRCVPSVAYRLALVAAGDADATVSTGGPTDWDVAGGHALLRSVGGELVDHHSCPVRYGRAFVTNVYGGSVEVASVLSRRGRAQWERTAPATVDGLSLSLPLPGAAAADTGLLSRAQGCLLGQLSGDALGSLVEFRSPEDIARRYPDGVREIEDGGTWDTCAGQPTDDSEMALTLARCLVRDREHDVSRIAAAYRAWLRSGPFDVGGTTRAGLTGEPRSDSLANGSLMRVSPLAVWAHAKTDEDIAELARRESGITHPHVVCRDACAAFCIAIAHGLRGEGARASYEAALAWAEGDADERVLEAMRRASETPPDDMVRMMGLVTKALQNALFRLLHASDLEEGVVATVSMGGDTDTNAAIAGALLGAVHSREGVPARWRNAVSSCHPQQGAPGVRRPRPITYWPVDALVLAERLLGTSALD